MIATHTYLCQAWRCRRKNSAQVCRRCNRTQLCSSVADRLTRPLSTSTTARRHEADGAGVQRELLCLSHTHPHHDRSGRPSQRQCREMNTVVETRNEKKQRNPEEDLCHPDLVPQPHAERGGNVTSHVGIPHNCCWVLAGVLCRREPD